MTQPHTFKPGDLVQHRGIKRVGVVTPHQGKDSNNVHVMISPTKGAMWLAFELNLLCTVRTKIELMMDVSKGEE